MTYPEHEKQHKILTESQTIGEFLDWMSAQGIHRMRWQTITEAHPCPRDGWLDHTHCPSCNGLGYIERRRTDWAPDHRSPLKLLADYYGIDLRKLEAEKVAMLDAARRLNQEAADGKAVQAAPAQAQAARQAAGPPPQDHELPPQAGA